MILPIQITFRNLEHSPAIEAYVRKRATKLELFGSVTRAHVVVEGAHRHHRPGSRYHVRIDLTLRGGELVVSKNPTSIQHEDVYACIDSAIDDAQRVIQDFVHRRRQGAKHHEPRPER